MFNILVIYFALSLVILAIYSYVHRREFIRDDMIWFELLCLFLLGQYII